MKNRNSRKDWATLALMGISAGLIVSSCEKGNADHNKDPKTNKNNQNQLSPEMKAFYSSLSPASKQKFAELDAQHRMMAVEMASQSCNGENRCAGMGGCAAEQHACAGKNECKAKGGPPVKNPDRAVDVQYNNQTLQRQKANSNYK